jgi:phage terminase Nu1 subunit (DNA packaging protein)
VAERLIEVGAVRIHLHEDEDAVALLRSLMRHVSNQEIADIVAVSERTVRRWKKEGRLPRRRHARLKLADLIEHLSRSPEEIQDGKRRRPSRGKAPRLDLAELVEKLTQELGGAVNGKQRPA